MGLHEEFSVRAQRRRTAARVDCACACQKTEDSAVRRAHGRARLPDAEYELKTTVGALTYTVSIVLMLGVSLAVSFFVARKNRKIDMVEALKGAE